MRLGWLVLLGFCALTAAPFVPYDDGEPDIKPTTEDAIAANISEEVNAERRNRSLSQLERSDRLDALAQAQAEDMADLDYVGHINSDGEGIRDRYADAGLLPECRLPTGDGRYYYGTEVTNQVVAGSEVVPHGVGGGPVEVSTPAEAATVTVVEFLASPGHRRALLLASADEIGVGVAVEGDDVYVAIELC
jgi:uncharacterized protein YkwD